MRKILNPFKGSPEANCFGCSPTNNFGLNLEFYENEDEIISEWKPKKHFSGFKNVLHGGIQSTLMDEIASWVVFTKLETAGVTAKLEVQYKRPLFVDDSVITLKAKVDNIDGRLACIDVKIFDSNKRECSNGKIYYSILDQEKAKRKLNYPGVEKFFE